MLFVGRERELQIMSRVLTPEGPRILLLSGLPGVGKSSLLWAFLSSGSMPAGGAHVLDCRNIEPTPDGFERAMADAGVRLPDRSEGVDAEQVAVVICLDHYEHLGLLDAWLRTWISAHREVSLVLASHSLPELAWVKLGPWVARLQLGALEESAVEAILQHWSIPPKRARDIERLTRGHPLALELACAMADSYSWGQAESSTPPEVIEHLARFFMDAVDDPQLRAGLEALACVRRATEPLLDELVGDDAIEGLYDRLAQVPLVERRADGLGLQPTVQETLSRWLRARNPERFTELRRRAWLHLERLSGRLAERDLWGQTADIIFLLDDPIIRGAFFPTSSAQLIVEPLTPEFEADLRNLVETQPPSERRALMEWLDSHPESFHVLRDVQAGFCGFYCLLRADCCTEEELERDPVTRSWRAQHAPLDEPPSLLIRRWLAHGGGDAPSPVQAAAWLDIKRAYLAGRPSLRRAFLAASDLAPYAQAAVRLEFELLEPAGDMQCALLDFGPGSVDAWLSRLVRKSLGQEAPVVFDEAGHSLIIEGQPKSLTPREHALLSLLVTADGRTIDRQEIYEEVWAGGQSVGSNVLESLVLGLRKKLAPHGAVLETVRGHGYRWTR